jgi:uncharacterized protein RhaS with RHS repeats
MLGYSANYRITVLKKKTGERVEGTTSWDGLASLYVVDCTDGQVRYASVLDDFITFDRRVDLVTFDGPRPKSAQL